MSGFSQKLLISQNDDDYAPINVFPHHPPLGIIWGNSGDLTYPNVKFPTVGQTEYVKYTYVYTCIYAYVKYTVYTCVKCPIVGQTFCVNSPSKAPLRPEGGVVGEYIDRCIKNTSYSLGSPILRYLFFHELYLRLFGYF